MYLEVDEARRAGDKARGREKDAADREVESVPGYSNGKEGRNEDEKRKWDSTDRDCETARIRCKKAMEDKHGEDRTQTIWSVDIGEAGASCHMRKRYSISL